MVMECWFMKFWLFGNDSNVLFEKPDGSLSNYFSWKIALGSGFAPAWVETESRPCSDNEFAK